MRLSWTRCTHREKPCRRHDSQHVVVRARAAAAAAARLRWPHERRLHSEDHRLGYARIALDSDRLKRRRIARLAQCSQQGVNPKVAHIGRDEAEAAQRAMWPSPQRECERHHADVPPDSHRA